MPSSRGSSVGSSDPRSRSPKSCRAAKEGKHWEDDTFKFNVESKAGSGRGERSEKDILGWISRTVCGFGRYPNKRPKGLVFDGAGAFSVNNLMEVWGKDHNLTEHQVVTAIQQNMFHTDPRGGEAKGQAPELRFAIDADPAGGVRIRVNPSRRKEQKGSRPIATPFRGRGERRGRSFDDGSEEDFLDQGRRGRGGKAWNNSRNNSRNSSFNSRRQRQRRPSSRDPWVGNQDPWASSRNSRPAPPRGLDKVQLPIPMDKPAQAPGACLNADCRLRAHSSGEHGGFCCQRCQWARSEGKPPEHGRLCEGVQATSTKEEPDVDMEGNGDSDVSPTKIVNFIDWILDVGYIEYDICKEEGQWLSINDLLSKLKDRQPQFGVHSVDRLRQVFADYVTEYEFTEDNKWLRKVDSEERRDPPSESVNPFSQKARIPAETPVVVEEDPSSSSAPTSLPVLTKVEPRDERAEVRRPPPPPPADGKNDAHWQKFSDSDSGQFWWFYNGPCGQWWCPDDGSNTVRIYTERP